MDCFGSCRGRRKKGKESTEQVPVDESDKKDKVAGTQRSSSLPRRGSLNSVQSNNTVYFDAHEDLDSSEFLGVKKLVIYCHDNSPTGSFCRVCDTSPSNTSSKYTESTIQAGNELDESRNSSSLDAIREDGSAKELGEKGAGKDHCRQAGTSFKRHPSGQIGSTDGIECWQVADPKDIMVRGKDYMSNKKKVHAEGAIYRLLGVDCYSFEQKLYHIAEHVQLPEPPQLGRRHAALPRQQQLPPLLVINIQLPLYKAGGLLGGGQTDGKGVSLVYYFALPDHFEPDEMQNKAALGLMQRFAQEGSKEQNGDKTRERLKLIARVVNVEEWAKEGPLSGYEHSLLNNYNNKPILTRPQQKFYSGENYLEVDLDVHTYAWLARKAFANFVPRLGPVIFENAFIIQGNRPDELPEMVMACARVSRIDLSKAQPFPAHLRKSKSHRTTIEMDTDEPLNATTFPDDELSPQPPDDQDEDFLESRPDKAK